MSKRDLQNYLKGLSKKQVSEQVLDLYDRFKDVKVFYDFAFNPQEDKLIDDFKTRVGKEYFPTTRRKPKMRRSVAQKLIKHFLNIELDPLRLLDAMLFNIETAQLFTREKKVVQESFYKSMFNSFEQALSHSKYHGIFEDVSDRFDRIVAEAIDQKWPNESEFVNVLSGINSRE